MTSSYGLEAAGENCLVPKVTSRKCSTWNIEGGSKGLLACCVTVTLGGRQAPPDGDDAQIGLNPRAKQIRSLPSSS